MTDRIRLIAEYSLTYAPHHVAERLGFFAQCGLEVVTDYDSGPGGSWLGDVLAEGRADVARGGVWIPMMYRRCLEDVRAFVQLCARNVQLILRRDGEAPFAVADLHGKTLMIPAAATSQWMFLEGLLREKGADLGRIRIVRDLDVKTTTRLWRAGFADYYLASAPLCDELVAEGFEVAADMAALGGPVPWSIYYAPAAYLADHPDKLRRFANALSQASAWIDAHAAHEVADLIAPDFAQWPRGTLRRALARMQDDRLWPTDNRFARDPLMRYQRMMVEYGIVSEPLAYEEIVASFARETVPATLA
jgi:NitT/TauT family transport system substrate-binding protein